MAPLFETIKSFHDVRISSEGIDTAGFLDATDGVVAMFDLFGSKIFGFIQTDLRNNIGGVRTRYQSNQDASKTLEELVKSEGTQGDQRHATACMVRLVRGLALIEHALKRMQDHPSDELHVCFKSAYDVVLRHHHAWVIRSVVTVAIRAVPHRRDFYHVISCGEPSDKFDPELKKWLQGLEVIVRRLKDFLEGGGYGRI
ncbi:glycolipid transfer protein [Lentinula raphanica]|uniref:Glycolipid transfer protein n=1 Tax=Lentinula raphanica TaxID=153919 RepID=A0AA38UF26_9AGAR|nr:glycolipid transfer protein domain-containing protein [Lentinula raphanica]KAJ3825037.1 glycolipid transfer protein [Lentinula raphanica]KAJ3839382.1 glycolipid transfer protein [Lentinula raphanica]KAJ3970920.1 glycolipid transfer protein [Lentinula raphanica]